MKHEALRPAKGRVFTKFQAIPSDDTSDACTEIGNACKDNKSVSGIANARHEPVCNEDQQDGHEADATSKPLQKCQRLGLFHCHFR